MLACVLAHVNFMKHRKRKAAEVRGQGAMTTEEGSLVTKKQSPKPLWSPSRD